MKIIFVVSVFILLLGVLGYLYSDLGADKMMLCQVTQILLLMLILAFMPKGGDK